MLDALTYDATTTLALSLMELWGIASLTVLDAKLHGAIRFARLRTLSAYLCSLLGLNIPSVGTRRIAGLSKSLQLRKGCGHERIECPATPQLKHQAAQGAKRYLRSSGFET